MEHHEHETSSLSILLQATGLISGASNRPRAWNKILQALIQGDPFFVGATVSVCRLDPIARVREILGSVGPMPHELSRQCLDLPDLMESAALLRSHIRGMKPVLVVDGKRPSSTAADFLIRLLPSSLTDSLIVLPLACNRRTTGMFWIEGFKPARCSREKIRTLQVLGNCISLALEDSIDRGEQEERDSVLRAALDAQEREREHIALDVHDGAIQLLASAFQHIQAARDGRRQDEEASRSALVKASGLLRETMYELRGLMDNLRPATLDRFGLIASLESDILDLRQGGWNAELVADPVKLAKVRETSLYRIVHEALTNIKKHAGVCQVSVTLKRRGPWLNLEIWDQGRGFRLGTIAQPGKRRGFGLLSMRKRTELLGGKFEVESSLGEGTRVSVQVPIRRKGD